MSTKITFLAIVAAFAMTAACSTSAFAQPLVTVDELGNGNFNGQPLPSFQSPEPNSGIVTLTYRLPFPAVPGDVQIFEPGAAAGPSDLIRFDGMFNLYFFSEIEPTDIPP